MPTSPDSKIPFDEFKKLLGPIAIGLTDEQILHLREIEIQIADIIFDIWLRKRNAKPEVAE